MAPKMAKHAKKAQERPQKGQNGPFGGGRSWRGPSPSASRQCGPIVRALSRSLPFFSRTACSRFFVGALLSLCTLGLWGYVACSPCNISGSPRIPSPSSPLPLSLSPSSSLPLSFSPLARSSSEFLFTAQRCPEASLVHQCLFRVHHHQEVCK